MDAALLEVVHLLMDVIHLAEEPMSKHTSFGIGGPVSVMFFPKTTKEIEDTMRALRAFRIDPLLIGNGTNLLVTDQPLNRAVVKISTRSRLLERDGERRVRFSSGTSLSAAAAASSELGLSGLEFAHGIPGTVGGGVYMNAGAYGDELGGHIAAVTALDENGAVGALTGKALDFSYRRSVFTDTKMLILSAEFELEPGDKKDISARIEELAQRRRSSQPLDMPSAGSTFKRPPGGYAAALIDEAGLRGYAIGGAQVSEKHTGFIVNRGGASFDDVLRLIEYIKETVFRRSGIILEPEVKLVTN